LRRFLRKRKKFEKETSKTCSLGLLFTINRGKELNRAEDGEQGVGASHRRHGTGFGGTKVGGG